MKIKKISVSVGLTQNMGDFESLRTDFFVEAELDEDEDVGAAHEKLVKAAKRKLIEQADSAYAAVRKYLDQ